MTPRHGNERKPADTEKPAVQRILTGTIRAAGRHGLKKLSMSDAADEAGVSRGTLYRYFASRESLFDAVGDYLRHSFVNGLKATGATQGASPERTRAMLEFIFRFDEENLEIRRLFDAEPTYVLENLRAELVAMQEALLEVLGPEMESSAVALGADADASMVAELLVRLAASQRLLPSTSLSSKNLVQFAALLCSQE